LHEVFVQPSEVFKKPEQEERNKDKNPKVKLHTLEAYSENTMKVNSIQRG
jgi:hypothetical protein